MNTDTLIERALREYYTEPRKNGLCRMMQTHNEGEIDGISLFDAFTEYVNKWPLAARAYDNTPHPYFIPVSEDNLDNVASYYAYEDERDLGKDFRVRPMRQACANFVLKAIARKRKRKFVPITFTV